LSSGANAVAARVLGLVQALVGALEQAVASVYEIAASTDGKALELALVAAQAKLVGASHRFEATRVR